MNKNTNSKLSIVCGMFFFFSNHSFEFSHDCCRLQRTVPSLEPIIDGDQVTICVTLCQAFVFFVCVCLCRRSSSIYTTNTRILMECHI